MKGYEQFINLRTKQKKRKKRKTKYRNLESPKTKPNARLVTKNGVKTLKALRTGCFCRLAGSQAVLWEAHVLVQRPEIPQLLFRDCFRKGVLLNEVFATEVATES